MEQENKITIKGIVSNIRTTKLESFTILRMSVATNRLYRNVEGTMLIETTWHTVVYYIKDGKEIPQIDKLSTVFVEGYLHSQRYTAADGIERTTFEIIANKVELIGEELTPEIVQN